MGPQFSSSPSNVGDEVAPIGRHDVMTHIASSSDGAIGARTQAAHGEGVAEQLDVSDNHVSPPCGRRSRAAIQGKRKRLRAQQDAEAAAINALADRSLRREKEGSTILQRLRDKLLSAGSSLS